jgi:hypothetical protein
VSDDDVCCLYWIYDDSWTDHGFPCPDVTRDGYVGVTDDPYRRIEKQHKKNRRFPRGFSCHVLLVGTREYCHEIERRLRPWYNIGWNVAPGGPGSGAFLRSFHDAEGA